MNNHCHHFIIVFLKFLLYLSCIFFLIMSFMYFINLTLICDLQICYFRHCYDLQTNWSRLTVNRWNFPEYYRLFTEKFPLNSSCNNTSYSSVEVTYFMLERKIDSLPFNNVLLKNLAQDFFPVYIASQSVHRLKFFLPKILGFRNKLMIQT